tara:strand:- start:1138 stop:1593 length:456 start_codon:yes stop_codon:yes gene_type:complete
MDKLHDLQNLYYQLDRLSAITGRNKLQDCNGRSAWPARGVYFFFDATEKCSDSGTSQRLVRIGTHALTQGAKSKLWTRLSQHKGQQASGGGNHRGSIFRLLVGDAMQNMQGVSYPTWGKGNTADRIVRESELELERKVSLYIGELQFVCLF